MRQISIETLSKIGELAVSGLTLDQYELPLPLPVWLVILAWLAASLTGFLKCSA